MKLLLYLNDTLVESEPLNLTNIIDSRKRDEYIQGAMKLLLEKWDGIWDQPGVQPRFVIKLEGSETL